MPKYSFIIYVYIRIITFWVSLVNVFICSKRNRKKKKNYFKNIEIQMLMESEKNIK
jgi:hypothetical protein